VAAPSLSESELLFLRGLLSRKVRFIVVGLSAAALQGAPVVTQDVDLWFENISDPRIIEALRDVGAAYVPPSIQNPPMFAGGGIELFDIVQKMDGVKSFADEWLNCAEVPLGRLKLKMLSLERILASKRAANRMKDKLVIPVLEDSLAARSMIGKAKPKRAVTKAKSSAKPAKKK
jgi:predicted nucleotidyltransferase